MTGITNNFDSLQQTVDYTGTSMCRTLSVQPDSAPASNCCVNEVLDGDFSSLPENRAGLVHFKKSVAEVEA